ncbi:hypothetical protein ACFV84_25790 [Kitasatospora sp. NPDC059811]|uniref:hypothetical protein n=1 Tax=Streptomycetaceae TaxID=2062 RepID=UPI000A9CDC13|nr:hypothetical protein [Streptomyces sp. MJM8645]
MSTSAQAAGDAPGAAPAKRRLAFRRNTPAAGPAALHQVGPHFVIAPGGADGTGPAALPAAMTAALGRLTAVTRTVTVLAAAPDAPAVLFGRLDELTRTATARDATALVLAASGLATAPDTGPRPAERIAELTGIGVVAPDGLVTLRPDGTLLTSGPTDDAPSSWWLCTPAGQVRRLGPVWPLPTEPTAAPAGSAGSTGSAGSAAETVVMERPMAETAVLELPVAAPVVAAPARGVPLGAVSAPGPAAAAPEPAAPARRVEAAPPAAPTPPAAPADPLVTALPHGYWFRSEPDPDGPSGPLTRATADEGTVILVVGHPGAPLPPAAELAARLRRLLPGPEADLLLSAPWAATGALTALATGLATELGHDLRAAVGLPMRTTSGFSSRVLAADGTSTWEPWLTELTASPTRRRVVASAWRTTPGGPAACGPALYESPVTGWRLEAVPAGLWLRPEEPPQDRGPRLRDPDPAHPLLIAGADGRTVPPEVLAVLDELRAALTTPGAAAPELLIDGARRGSFLPAAQPTQPAQPAVPATVQAAAVDPQRPAPEKEFATAATITAAIPPASAVRTQTAATADPDAQVPAPDEEFTAATATLPEPPAPVQAQPQIPEPATPPAAEAPTPEPAPLPDPEPTLEPEPEPEPVPEPEPAPDPEPTPEPEPAPAPEPEAPTRARLLAPDGTAVSGRPSTAAERTAFRALLGEHFQRCASRAEQVAMRLPALRSHSRDDLKSDLAAVYLHHVDTGVPVLHTELVVAARRPGSGPLDPYLACLGSGLRRLPNHRGAVLLGADAGEEELRHYVPGTLLVEPAPVVGTPALEVAPGTPVEFLVWSATGRRTSVIAEDGEPEVVFPPGSWFSVLEVMPGEDGEPTRVLLREVGPGATAGTADERDQQALERLLAWQARRDLLAPEDLRSPSRPERLRLTPGVTAAR